MKNFELRLFSLKGTPIIKIESSSGEIDNFIFSLLSVFAKGVDCKNRKMTIESLQRKTELLVKKIYDYVDHHKDQIPAIYKLKTFIDSLSENEYFYIFQNMVLDARQIVEISNQLVAINQSEDFEEINASYNELFAFVYDNYNMAVYDGSKTITVGESNKAKRTCRFCQKKHPTVTFKKKAHAISEALGNKTLVTNEECDACNGKFGEGIENDIIAYLSVHRSYFGIKGKGSGHPKLKGANFSIHKTADQTVEFKVVDNDNDEFNSNIDAQTHERISLQNIYRALCKYTLSLVDVSELPALKKTIDWINEEYIANQLPKVKVQLIHSFYAEQPSLSIYMRRNNNKETPHIIGEFRFACFVFVFVVPFSTLDEKQFIDDNEFSDFWDKFHYSQGQVGDAWTELDLSDSDRKKLVFNIKFEKQKNV